MKQRETGLKSESYGGPRSIDKCQYCLRFNVIICTHLDDHTEVTIEAINEWTRDARESHSRQPIYGISEKFRVVSRPGSQWVLQKKALAKGTAEIDPWSDIRQATTREKALDQLEQQDGYRQFLARPAGHIAA